MKKIIKNDRTYKIKTKNNAEDTAIEVGLSIHAIKKKVGILRNANILDRKGSKKMNIGL